MRKEKKDAEKKMAKRFQNQKSTVKKSKKSFKMAVVNSVISCREVKKDQDIKVFIDLATWRKVSYNFI